MNYAKYTIENALKRQTTLAHTTVSLSQTTMSKEVLRGIIRYKSYSRSYSKTPWTINGSNLIKNHMIHRIVQGLLCHLYNEIIIKRGKIL